MCIQAVEKFKSLAEMNYKEPVNGKFGDCTKDILKELGGEESDDENADDLEESELSNVD